MPSPAEVLETIPTGMAREWLESYSSEVRDKYLVLYSTRIRIRIRTTIAASMQLYPISARSNAALANPLHPRGRQTSRVNCAIPKVPVVNEVVKLRERLDETCKQLVGKAPSAAMVWGLAAG